MHFPASGFSRIPKIFWFIRYVRTFYRTWPAAIQPGWPERSITESPLPPGEDQGEGIL